MKHRHKNRILGRTADERKRLLKNLQSSLLEHRSIVTTEARAKELRKFFEPLITEARGELTLHRRRRLLKKLYRKDDLVKLLEVAKSQKDRPGGYVRLTKLPITRMDAAAQVRVEIVEKK